GLVGVEGPPVAGDLRLVGRGIEPREPRDPAPPVHERVPGGRDVEADGCHGAEARDHDAPRHGWAAVRPARSRSEASAPTIEEGSDTFTSFTSAMRFTSPFTTCPAPISTNVEAPRSAMNRTERSHPTRCERWRTSASGMCAPL